MRAQEFEEELLQAKIQMLADHRAELAAAKAAKLEAQKQ